MYIVPTYYAYVHILHEIIRYEICVYFMKSIKNNEILAFKYIVSVKKW